MAEPTSSAVALGSAATVTLFGIATGLPADLIAPAFVGALWSLRMYQEVGVMSRVSQVAVGTLAGAWAAIPLSTVIGGFLPAAAGVAAPAVKYIVAFGAGFGGLYAMERWLFKRGGE